MGWSDKVVGEVLESEDVRAKVYLRVIMKKVEDALDAVDEFALEHDGYKTNSRDYFEKLFDISQAALEDVLEVLSRAEENA